MRNFKWRTFFGSGKTIITRPMAVKRMPCRYCGCPLKVDSPWMLWWLEERCPKKEAHKECQD